MIAQLFREWLDQRRRVKDELEFHRDHLEQEFTSHGYSASAAGKLARQQLGSFHKHQQHGREELKARIRDLAGALITMRSRNPWISPSLVTIASLFVEFLLPRDVLMAIPVVIWLAVLLCMLPREVPQALQYRSQWRYHFYSVSTLLSTSLAASAVWTGLLLIWRLPRWPSQGWSVSIFVVELIAYLLACGLALQLWSRNRLRRCRSCARKLCLPDEKGRLGNLLVDTAVESSVCIHGHGALTVSYWQNSWRGNGAFWNEIFKASHY